MIWRIVLFLFITVLLGWKGPADASESEDFALDDNCSSYTISIIKPLLQRFEETKEKLDNHNKEMESKNNKINEMEKKVIQLQRETASKAEIKTIFKEQTRINEDLIKSMKQEIHTLLKFIERQQETMCERQNHEITELKEEVSSNAQELKQCEMQLTTEQEKNNGKGTNLKQAEQEIKDLSEDIEEKNAKSCITSGDSSSVYYLTLSNGNRVAILCNSDIAGPGWTVIQQRINGETRFDNNWITYREGFGTASTDFFLGLETIHRLTSEQPHELYIHIVLYDDSTLYARYDEFAIAGEYDKYRITKLGRFTGNTTDSLEYHTNMPFTTYDNDNDMYLLNCATLYSNTGWWYNNCALSNLNGYNEGLFWGLSSYLKQVKMMIRTKGV